MTEDGEHSTRQSAPLSTLLALERTIAERRTEMEAETGKLSFLANSLLLTYNELFNFYPEASGWQSPWLSVLNNKKRS